MRDQVEKIAIGSVLQDCLFGVPGVALGAGPS
jgi:hypothetical protein